MRYVLIDRARARSRHKRGGARRRITLDEAVVSAEERAEEIVAVDEALQVLAGHDPRLAQIVEMRFFGGFSNGEIAEALDTSLRTVERGWRVARAFLLGELAEPPGDAG
jgi:RNA polymerase sigma factor (TIGR02999 family)